MNPSLVMEWLTAISQKNCAVFLYLVIEVYRVCPPWANHSQFFSVGIPFLLFTCKFLRLCSVNTTVIEYSQVCLSVCAGEHA